MIDSINFNGLRTSENVQFFNDLVQICSDNKPEDLGIALPLKGLNEATQVLNSNFKSNGRSQITAELIELDTRRDNAIVCLRMLVEAFTHHFNPDFKDAAILILSTIDKYGKSIARLNYQAETSILENLGDDLLKDPKTLASLKTLKITSLVNEMVEANNVFNHRFLARVKESAEIEQAALGELLKDTILVYRNLTAHIEAHITLTPSEELMVLHNQINELIERYNSLTDHRRPSTAVIIEEDE